MLHIERGEYVDAGGQQFLDVLPTLRVALALPVRVRELIDQQQLRTAQQCGVQIEFAELLAPIRHHLG